MMGHLLHHKPALSKGKSSIDLMKAATAGDCQEYQDSTSNETLYDNYNICKASKKLTVLLA